MHGERARAVFEQAPDPHLRRHLEVGHRVEDPLERGVLSHRGVDGDHDEVRLARRAQWRDRQPAALVLPEVPVGDLRPGSPAVARPPAPVEVPADAVERLVLRHRVVDGEDHELGVPVTVEVGHGEPGALVLPERPVRQRLPGPPVGHGAVGVERAAAVVGGVRAVGGVDHEHDQVGTAVAVDVRDRDVPAGVRPGEPVGDELPVRPPAGHRSGRRVQRPTDPEPAQVRSVRGVEEEHDEVERTVAVHVGNRDTGALVLVGEPVGDGLPRRLQPPVSAPESSSARPTR